MKKNFILQNLCLLFCHTVLGASAAFDDSSKGLIPEIQVESRRQESIRDLFSKFLYTEDQPSEYYHNWSEEWALYRNFHPCNHDLFYQGNLERLTPYVNDIKAFIRSHGDDIHPNMAQAKSIILFDLDRHIEKNDLSADLLLYTLFRFEAAFSNFEDYQDEVESFFDEYDRHPINSLVFLYRERKWENEQDLMGHLERSAGFYRYDFHQYRTNYENLHPSIANKGRCIEERIELNLPTPTLIMVLGQSYLGIRTLIDHNLNDRFPVAFPSIKSRRNFIRSHGVDMSVFGFAYHDVIHHNYNGHRIRLYQYAVHMIEQILEHVSYSLSEIQIDSLIDHAVNKVTHHHGLLQNYIKNFLIWIDNHYFQNIQIFPEQREQLMSDYLKIIGGAFLHIHETTFEDGSHYWCSTLEETLNQMRQKSLSWMEKNNHEFTGEETDEEIIAILKKEYNITSCEIQKNRNRIKVKIVDDNDKGCFATFYTLYRHHQNALNEIAFLDHTGGYMPGVFDETDSFQAQKDEIDHINAQLCHRLNSFFDALFRYGNEVHTDGGTCMQHYTRSLQDILNKSFQL